MRKSTHNGNFDTVLTSFGYDPQERYFYHGEYRDESRLVGKALIERPGHWGAIISDSTGPIGQDTVEYFLRSELLACIVLLRRQMNKTIWIIRDTRPRKFVGWNLM